MENIWYMSSAISLPGGVIHQASSVSADAPKEL